MSDSSADRIEGGLDKLKGGAKEKVGDLTGNEQAQAEGSVDQGKGEAKEKLADVKDSVDDAVRKLTGNDKP